MPLIPIRLNPGVNVEATKTLNESGWAESNSIRFFQGLPEKEGGFVAFCKTPANSGYPQALRAWTALSEISWLAIACQNMLNVFGAGVVSDITGDVYTVLNDMHLSTTSGSATVTLSGVPYLPSVGDWLQIRCPVSVGGLVLYGPYQVTGVGVSSYTFVANSNATSTVADGGYARRFTTTAGSPIINVYFPDHQLFNGEVIVVPYQLNYHTTVGGIVILGNYTATVIDADNFTITAPMEATANATVTENNGQILITFYAPSNSHAPSNIQPWVATWSLTTWGEFLMACPEDGPVLVWMPAKGPGVPAAVVMTAPLSNHSIFVATQQQMLFCLGTVDLANGEFDPMLVRWSDAGDYTDFVPSSTNQAGSFRLSTGSEIIAGLPLAGGNLIWTDLALYQCIYLQPPLVWGFQPQGVNCGLVGRHAFGTLGQAVFWMSQKQFFVWQGGSPTQLPCPVWDRVFKNIDLANISKVVCETNAFFNEVAWEVQQADGTTTRARLQVGSGNWDYTILPNASELPRTAWIDQSVFGPPLAADATGQVWQHEVGNDAGPQPLEWSLKSGLVEIAEGDRITFIRGLYPDFKFTPSGDPGPGTVEMLVYFWGYSQDPPRIKGPFPINSTTRFVPCKGRARGVEFEFRGRDLGSWVRLGAIKYRGAPDGRRS